MAPTTKKAGKKGAAAPAKPAAVAGKKKAPAAKPAPVPAPPADEIDEDEEDDESEDEDEDEENGGVSEKGMKRLLELVGPEDLDEFEVARLGSDEDEDEEDDDDEGEEDDEEMEENEDEDEEDEEEDNTIVVAEADPDAVAVDELGSDVSVDEDAVPMRKLTTSNKPAMRVLTEGIKMTNTPWPEHLISQSSTILDVDPSDDLQREMAFYKLALEAVPAARKLANKFGIPFSRPNDYYAEMVKSDEHMERVRTKLVEEAQGIKKSEEAKKQRELKKYGKQIQVENLKAREQDKKSFADRVAGIKRKRKDGAEIGDEGDDDEFGIGLEDDDAPRGGGRAARGRGAGGKPKMPRSARDAKYSLGGSSRRAKQNDRDSANDFSAFGSEHKRGGGKGGRGGKAGGAGGRGGKAGGAAQRPGKSKRHSRRK